MGRYITQALRVKKQQVFTVSGIFTPSPGLLAAGGVVEVRCVGAGGGGGYMTSHNNGFMSYPGAGGGSGADITRIVTVAGPVEVTIGSGGGAGVSSGSWQDGLGNTHTGATPGGDGGTTSFGDLVAATGGKGGRQGSVFAGGQAGGEGGQPGQSGGSMVITSNNNSAASVHIFAGAGGGAGGTSCHSSSAVSMVSAPANSGGGGAGGYLVNKPGNGGSGICIITWEE